MEVFVIEEFEILHMSDVVLSDYHLYTSKEAALKAFPDAIVEGDHRSELSLENAIDKQLSRMFGVAYVLKTSTLYS